MPVVSENALAIWTIYHRPRDMPGVEWCVRRWLIMDGRSTPDLVAVPAKTLEAARQMVPPGLVRLDRLAEDDPVIVETWI